MNDNYYRHYLTLDEQSRVVGGWSNGPHCGCGAGEHDVLLTDAGTYDFRLFPDGEADPVLMTNDGIPLYKWENGAVAARTEAEIEADRAAREDEEPTEPTEMEKLRADVDYIMVVEGLL